MDGTTAPTVLPNGGDTSVPAQSTGGPQRRQRNGDRLSRMVFTLPNWTDAEYQQLKEFGATCKWFIMGKEKCPKTGTPHLQGAAVLGRQVAFSTLKTTNGFKRAHLERMNGRPEDSASYCRKEDSNPFECGTPPTPGKRTDVIQAVSRVRSGETLRDLAQDDEGGVAIVKFHKGLTVLRGLCRPPRTTVPRIYWFYGPTGVGKTRMALKVGRAFLRATPGARVDDIWISSGGLRWFDGFDGQLVAILDDFRAKHVSNFAFFLRLLDRYPMAVEFKGGFVPFTPQFIFITSPNKPEVCFSKRQEHVPEDIKQLIRRIEESSGGILDLAEFKLREKAVRKEFTRAMVEDYLAI